MNTNLKIGLALAVLVAAVIGVTVITQYTDPEKSTPGPAAGGPAGWGGPPLVYPETVLQYDPASENYAKRVFPGFFEVNAETHWATFLLRNERTEPVRLSAQSRSCTACSQARLAVLTPADNRQLARDAQPLFAAAVGGLHPAAPDTAVYRRAEQEKTLAWQPLDFDHKEKTIEIPPAVGPTVPTWCVLQLGFEVKLNGFKSLSATIGMTTAERATPVEQAFTVGFFGDSAERVSRSVLDFGTLAERSGPVTRELYYWSTTRPQSAFAPPKVIGTDPFLSAAAPVPLTPAELDAIARQMSAAEKYAFRARSGYKLSFTLRRDNPSPAPGAARELDIGPVEKTLNVTGSDGTTAGQSVSVRANVTGLVSLAAGTAVDLGDFPQKNGTEGEFKLNSDRLDLELEPVNGGTGEARDRNPPGVTVTQVGTPVTAGGRKQWAFKLTVAPDSLGGDLATRLLVFRVKATGQIVRLPLRGFGNNR